MCRGLTLFASVLLCCLSCSEVVVGYLCSPVLTLGLGLKADLHCRAQRNMCMHLSSPMITIGTRGSPLALAQAYETKTKLERSIPELGK